MLSKNNRHLQEQRMSDSKQRFSIRKYSFGAASVLLGLSFMTYAGGSPVSADTTDQPAVTVTEPTDKASTAQTTATSEASSTATSEAAKQTSEAVSSTATSESAAVETTPSSETASKETVTSEAAKESTAPSEASKISTATSEASEKASTATSESTTPATATSKENSQEQTTSSEMVDTNALTASKVAKTSALKSVKLAALKLVKLAAATTTTSTDDVASAKEGKITDEGKAKGLNDSLTDSDVTPRMSDANGAKLVISKIPDGYEADPTEGRYTFGILSLGPVEKNGSDLTSYNEKYNTNYYIRMSTASQGTNGTYDDTVYIQLVDANDNHKVLWEASAKPGDVNQTITALKPTKNNPFQYSYKEATVSGVTSKIIDFNASPIDANNGTMYSINVYENGSSAGNSATTDVAFKYPATSTLETRYIAKDAAGNETILATYDETGRVGYTYTASGSRNFVGYDKVPAPSSTTGVLQASYKVGDTYFGGAAPISDQLQMAVVRVVADSDGTATVQLRVATKDASTSNINDTSVWKTVFTSEELKPGEVSKTGDNLINGTNYTKGAVALSKTSNLYSKIKSVGFTEEQLTGLIGSNWSIINKLAPGQSSVNYYYAPQGQVRVNYVTSDGKTLQAPITVYENSSAGTSYDAANYRPATITVNGKTYHWVKSDKSLGTPGTTTINGYTYYVTPSDETGKISSNTVSDVYYVYKLLTYRTEVETKDVTRTIEYYDSVTNKPIPDSLEKTVTQTATLKRNKIYDDQNNFIGYGTISADGSSYTIDDSWTVDAQTWTQQDSADLSGYGYTAPDRPSVAAVTVDGNTTTVTEMVRYGHQTQTITPNDPNPVTPGKPINPKGDVNYPDGVSKDDLTSTVKRTIKYVDEDGKAV
ncbi:YSIRK-type signal peptide-containing protein, partial [Lactobacillus delbrueckii]|uniref:YSIRK-type signal peptide-containing protein n=1 Tax=Lactobacillus delbrueckii TaxID=1584 RepID=UPI003992430C